MNHLYIEVFIGCDLLMEMLYDKEDINVNDKDYAVIKKYFFDRLINYATEKRGNWYDIMIMPGKEKNVE